MPMLAPVVPAELAEHCRHVVGQAEIARIGIAKRKSDRVAGARRLDSICGLAGIAGRG